MKKLKEILKILVILILIVFVWYFITFSKFSTRNLKNVLGLFSLRDNFDSNVVEKNSDKFYYVNNNVISITFNSKKISSVIINLYDKNNDLIDTISYDSCFLKKNNTCTYLVENYKTKKIKIDSNTSNVIKINDKSQLKNMKDKIIINFIYSAIIVSFLIVFIKISLKYNFDKKIMKKLQKISLNKAFVIIAFSIGVVTSVLIPLYQVPDELTHINLIYQERNINKEFQDLVPESTGAEDIIRNVDNRVNSNKYFDFSQRISINDNFKLPNIKIVRHFPQSIGMFIGEMLHFPVFLYITFAELCALIFYIFICNLALKKVSVKKHLMMFIMLLPVAIQQMASFSYDVVLNSFCFLFIASIFDLKINDKKINEKEIIKILLLLFVIIICKFPYIILGLLVFILPIKNLDVNVFGKKITYNNCLEKFKQHKVLYFVILAILSMVTIAISFKMLLNANIGRIFIASLINPINTLNLYIKTFRNFSFYYLDTIAGNLGWFDTKFPFLFELFVYIMMFIVTFYKSGDKKSNINDKFNSKDKLIIYMIAIILIYIIVLSMFEWTLYCTHIANHSSLSIKEHAYYIKTIPYIGGVQGRYFLPVLPLILLPIKSEKISKKIDKISPLLCQIIYYVVLFVIMITVILNRYWF